MERKKRAKSTRVAFAEYRRVILKTFEPTELFDWERQLRRMHRAGDSTKTACRVLRAALVDVQHYETYLDGKKFSARQLLDMASKQVYRIEVRARDKPILGDILMIVAALKQRLVDSEPDMVVFDPITPEERDAPAELRKKKEFGDDLAQTLERVATGCEVHGRVAAKTWRVSVEMRGPIAGRDRFFVVVDADDNRVRSIGPMSADVADHLLAWVESALAANLAGAENGTVTRKIQDLSTS